MSQDRYTASLASIGLTDIEQFGGKNASLGEMIQHLTKSGVKVPQGFATTADAYRAFLSQSNLQAKIDQKIKALSVDNIQQLRETGTAIRQMILDTPFLPDFEQAVKTAYRQLSKAIGVEDLAVAVRSSATAEDLPDASFAGQQETYLNIQGIDAVLQAMKQVFASLYSDRAMTYRVHHGFVDEAIALSVGVQQMVRSDKGASGVLFTIDTESGFNEVVFITATYGLGELLVQGAVNPDEYYLYKPALKASRPAILKRRVGSKLSQMVYQTGKALKTVQVNPTPEAARHQFVLTDTEMTHLAKQALLIEAHYKRPMDIEWAKDGVTQEIYIVQARPETVKSRADAELLLEKYQLKEKSAILTEGRSIGQRIGQGEARIIHDVKMMHEMKTGEVLVADMTDPDWEPVMKRASAIITNRGGRTCHAAIIARELGIPAVVGCSDATTHIQTGQKVTVSCAEGETGFVYEGLLAFERTTLDVEKLPELPLKIMLNVGSPDRAFSFASVPNSGVGLARLEFLISNTIGIHPRALLDYEAIQDAALKKTIAEKIAAYASPRDFFVEKLKEGISTIAAAFYPKPVIVRLSDFKSNEYANLLGGRAYEPVEENPMLGFRGASRYVAPSFEACFAMECQAIRQVREEMGLTNVEVMIPFVRTIPEIENVIQALKKNGLARGKAKLRLIMMCEIPSNALCAEAFLKYVDGFSIGSNDLTQLTLGIDRDSGLVAQAFDERNEAVKALMHLAIQACKKAKKYIGICGQGPSDHQDFATWLMQEGVDSISLNPDSVLATCLSLSKLTGKKHATISS